MLLSFRPSLIATCLAMCATSCSSPADAPVNATTVEPVYSQQTGRLEQIVSDRNGDGTIDTRAFMSGTVLQRIEIDRNGDTRPDRWEHYEKAATARAASEIEIDRAEEANGPDDRITRREFYVGGIVVRVEEDTDVDGRVDKWEHFDRGQLARIELDLKGAGFPDRRMVYRRDGSVEKVEVDSDGRGDWRPFQQPAQ